jgi:peptidoglycan hydrolase-like protein with peptidoglycan-binding domain
VSQEVAAINRLASHGYGPRGTDHYGSSSTLGNKGPVVALGLDLWVAQYGSNNGQPQGSPSTGAWSTARLWQYTSNGQLPGYGGRLDLSTDTFTGSGGGTDSGWDWINQTVYPISMIQQKINEAGYSPALDVDNLPGPKTEAGIKWYQAKVGVDADGIVGPITAGKMFGAANPSPAVGGNITARPTSDVQARLNQVLGTNLAVDGKYGPLTTQAVESYQTSVGIAVDGIYGPDTDGHLFGNGTPVALTVDGIWGPMTTQRVQLALHCTVDGIRGPETNTAIQRLTGAGVDGIWGPDTARHLQQYLVNKGYSVGASGVDGDFGHDSTVALQQSINDGKFGA